MPDLSHLNERGEARMVDVGAKSATHRQAAAAGRIILKPETVKMISQGFAKKGDVLAVARIAGIMAAKKTSDLIPLCHNIPISHAAIDFEEMENGFKIVATVETVAATGVEMEALTAVSVASLTIYDMVKSVDRAAEIQAIRLLEKSGGKSGVFKREG